MAIILHLTSDDHHLHTRHGEQTLATTPLADLPDRAAATIQPYEHGPALFRALGGDALLTLLDADPDQTLYLAIPGDDPADAIPWECAVIPPRSFLVHRCGLLRLVERTARLDDRPAPVRLIVLGADALVDDEGHARDGHRLDFLSEMSRVERVLLDSGRAVSGERISPTPDALQFALNRNGHALLHLSCHGDLLQTDHGPIPMLHLEDENGGPAKLWGSDLVDMTRLTDLRLILLSACRTGQQAGIQGRLTRTLVEQAVPAAIGMQGLFPDYLSGALAAALYQALLSGRTLAQALQAARLALRQNETAVGLPVAYICQNGDGPLPLHDGRPSRQRLDRSAHAYLPPAVQAPEPFIGRNLALHQLARLTQSHPVITIIGTGGMGKTALAAAYARRFALRYRDGVLGYSFAGSEVDDATFRRELLLRLVGDELADQSPQRQETAILDALRERELLLLVDNYESVQEALTNEQHPHHAAAGAIHGLLAKMTQTGGRLLLTSRQQPAGLAHERVFPGRDRLLQGINLRDGADLFYRHSPRANERRGEKVIQELARQVAQVTAGHPLAIALLGSEFDQGDVAPDRFLADWGEELAHARSLALDDHHATFTTAFNRSYDALSQDEQQQLRALSLIPFPFFDVGAALLWRLDERDDEERSQTRALLRRLVDRSLIEIDLFYSGGDKPATWRFQPALWQEVARRLPHEEREGLLPHFARYAAWLSGRAYGDIHKEGNTALVRHVRPVLDSLIDAADYLHGAERLWHLRRVGWLLNAFGRTGDAYELLTAVLPPKNFSAEAAEKEKDEREWQQVRSSLLYEIANLEVTRGDLDRALALYEESLAVDEQIGDIQGKAASLGNLANLYIRQKDWDRAEELVLEALELVKVIGEPPAFEIVKLGQIAEARGDIETARNRYAEGIAIFEKMGMPEANQVRQMLAAVEGASPAPAADDLSKILEQLSPEERAQLEAQMQAVQQQLANLSAEERAQLETAAGVQQAVRQARAAAEQRQWPAAIRHQQQAVAQQQQAVAQQQQAVAHQKQAVAQARTLADQRQEQEALVQLSILLYNLAGYYQQAGRHAEAVAAYEEVVALDEQTGHEDLEADRRALAQARQLAERAAAGDDNLPTTNLPPQLAALIEQLSPADRAALGQMPPKQQAQVLQALAQLAAMSPEEQAAHLRRAQFAQVEENLLGQLAALLAACRGGELPAEQQAAAAGQIDNIANQLANETGLGDQRHDLVKLLRCAAAYLRGETVPVPAAYAERWAGWVEGSDERA
jgi:tetratricopeptide (TPR) repeat protein